MQGNFMKYFIKNIFYVIILLLLLGCTQVITAPISVAGAAVGATIDVAGAVIGSDDE